MKAYNAKSTRKAYDNAKIRSAACKRKAYNAKITVT